MALQISRARIGVAVMNNSGKVKKLNPILYHGKRLSMDVQNKSNNKEVIRKQLLDIAKAENVCGFVVGWPLEPSGSPGSRCGQVLNLLDYFTETRQEGGCLINKHSRPVVFLDERKFTHGQFDEERDPMDEWGRCRVFGKKFPLPPKDEFGNEKKYTFKTSLRSDHPVSEDSTSASLILEHYVKTHVNTKIKISSKYSTTPITPSKKIECSQERIDETELEQFIESFEHPERCIGSNAL